MPQSHHPLLAAADLCAGKYTSEALVSASIERARARADLNAFITLDEAGALKAAGAVILGKTNMHELAFGITGYNTAFKSSDKVGVRNAYDVTKIAGGSSSGNGAAIGARIVTAGLGTDTGGSVRIPCALNGCASLRPTVGRYAQQGIAPI